ncbi:MAG: arginase [Cryomorphaceae bacterium]|nr:arginase [Cryomorphaceae bacterium]
MSRKIKFIGNTSELGAGTRGSSMGLDALKIASFSLNKNFFRTYKVEQIPNLNDKLFEDIKTNTAKRLDGIVEMYNRISQVIGKAIKNNRFPVVIAGDHSNAGGTIKGIKEALPNDRLGVIWIDAHADLHSPYTSPSGNVHGMPLATAIMEDNLDCQAKKPSQTTINNWNLIKGDVQRVKPDDLFFIGVRSTEKPEDELMKRFNIPNVKVPELTEKGAGLVAKNALNHLSNCDKIYVSFDVDSLDSSISVGTGTPVPGGLSEEQATQLLIGILKDPRVVCLEFTEINPVLDTKGNVMAETAFRILEKAVNQIEKTIQA